MNEPNYWLQAAATIIVWMLMIFLAILLLAGIKWAWGLLVG